VLRPQSRWEDAVFHRCAEVETTDARVIPFVPPDGPFCLMRYRITATQSNIPLFVTPKFQWRRGGVAFDLAVRPDASLVKPLDGLELRFELPEGVAQPALTAADGQARWEAADREVVWAIGLYEKKGATQLRGTATTDAAFDLGGRFPIVTVRFVTTGVLSSSFRVERFDVSNVSYKSFKGVKYVVRAGNYEFRTGLS
jgi:AP-3 complex subunit mu